MAQRYRKIVEYRDNRCIWMQEGVISYKLCSLDYRCEDCELDKALRDHSSLPVHVELDLEFPEVKKLTFEEIIGDTSLFHLYDYALIRLIYNYFSSIRYSLEVQYSPSHLWVYDCKGYTKRIGLDDFIGRCLDPIEHIVFPIMGDYISEKATICWLFFDNWNIRLSSPLAGQVTAINSAALQQNPKSLQSDSYRRGWLLEIMPEQDSFSQPFVEGIGSVKQWYKKGLLDIFHSISVVTEQAGASASATMSDGGIMITQLRQVMGKENYIRLVKKFLKYC